MVHDVPSNKIDELDVNENNDLTDDEQKLVQRANEAPTVTNQSDVLREAFYEWVSKQKISLLLLLAYNKYGTTEGKSIIFL